MQKYYKKLSDKTISFNRNNNNHNVNDKVNLCRQKGASLELNFAYTAFALDLTNL